MKQILFIAFFVLFAQLVWAQYGSIKGQVIDEELYEPLPFVDVVLVKDLHDTAGTLVKGVYTDFDGYYEIDSIPPATYQMKVSYVGMQTQQLTDIIVKEKEVITMDIGMKEDKVLICYYPMFFYVVPLMPRNRNIPGSGIEVRFGRNYNRPDIGISSYTK